MRRGFLPVRDGDLLAWSANVVAQTAADPPAWGLTEAQRDLFVAAQNAFAAAMEGVQLPVRSRSTVVVKDEARAALEAAARKINTQVRGAGVASDAQLTRLGLTVAKTAYRRIGRPQMRPSMHVRAVNGSTIKLETRDLESTRIALPDDVATVAIYHWVGPTPPTDYDRWPVAGQVARARLTLSLDAPLGTPVHFVARYLNRRGECGPWSEVTMTYAMGGLAFGTDLLAA